MKLTQRYVGESPDMGDSPGEKRQQKGLVERDPDMKFTERKIEQHVVSSLNNER